MPNAALAQKILDMVTLRPETLDMGNWADLGYSEDAEPLTALTIPLDTPVQEINVCDSTLCISGWALALTGWTIFRGRNPEKEGEDFRSWEVNGMLALGIDFEDASRLFFSSEPLALAVLRQLAGGAKFVDWDAAEDEVYGKGY